MLVNFTEMLQKAKSNHYAVPHFNINNLEWTKYILEECNKLNVPVILGVSEGAAKYMGGYLVVSSLVTALIKTENIKIRNPFLRQGSFHAVLPNCLNSCGRFRMLMTCRCSLICQKIREK